MKIAEYYRYFREMVKKNDFSLIHLNIFITIISVLFFKKFNFDIFPNKV